VHSPETWTKLPSYVPSTISWTRDVVADWWTNVADRGETLRGALAAAVLALALIVVTWLGVQWQCRAINAYYALLVDCLLDAVELTSDTTDLLK
jgi:hypothetical protein